MTSDGHEVGDPARPAITARAAVTRPPGYHRPSRYHRPPWARPGGRGDSAGIAAGTIRRFRPFLT